MNENTFLKGMMMQTVKRNGVVKPSDEVLNILRRSRVEGNLLHLPPERLSPADYKAVKVAIEAIGGKWKGGKVQAHVFEGSPADALAGLLVRMQQLKAYWSDREKCIARSTRQNQKTKKTRQWIELQILQATLAKGTK